MSLCVTLLCKQIVKSDPVVANLLQGVGCRDANLQNLEEGGGPCIYKALERGRGAGQLLLPLSNSLSTVPTSHDGLLDSWAGGRARLRVKKTRRARFQLSYESFQALMGFWGSEADQIPSMPTPFSDFEKK